MRNSGDFSLSFLINFIIIITIIIITERGKEDREEDTEKDNEERQSSHLLVHSPNVYGQDLNLHFPIWITGIQLLQPSLQPPRVYIRRELVGRVEQGIQSRHGYMGSRHLHLLVNHCAKYPPGNSLP